MLWYIDIFYRIKINKDEKDAKNFIFGVSCQGFVRFGLQQAIYHFTAALKHCFSGIILT